MKKKTFVCAAFALLFVTVLSGCGFMEPEAFATPENVTVEGTELTWDAQAGAESYTVRVNGDDGKRVTVYEARLSLAEGEIVGYFSAGSNALQVKTNASAERAESAYGEAVTFFYAPAQAGGEDGEPDAGETEPEEPDEGGEEGETENPDGGEETEEPDGDEEAEEPDGGEDEGETEEPDEGEEETEEPDGEEEGEEPDGGEETEEPNGEEDTGSGGEASSAEPWAAPSELTIENGILRWTGAEGAEVYLVCCAGRSAEVCGTSFDLNGATELALPEGEEVVLSVYVKATEEHAESAAAEITYAVPLSEETKADAVSAAKEALSGYLARAAEGDAETVIVLAAEAKELWSSFGEFVQEDAEVSALYGAVLSAEEAAKEQISASVESLTAFAEGFGEIGAEKLNTEYYERLLAFRERAEALGAYAASLCDKEALLDGIAKELQTLLQTPLGERAQSFVTQNGAEGRITVLYEAENLLGEVILFSALPALSLKLDGERVENVAVTEQESGVYVYTATVSAEVGYTLAYEVGGAAASAVYTQAAVSFEWGSEADGDIDVYAADAFTAEGIADFPLFTLRFQGTLTVSALRRLLAVSYPELIGETFAVCFVLRAENGVYGEASAERYTLNLTEEDKRLELADEWTYTEEFFSAFAADWALTASVRISVYDASDLSSALFFFDCTADRTIGWEEIGERIWTWWRDESDRQAAYTFVFGAQAIAGDEAKTEGYLDSEPVFLTENGVLYQMEYAFTFSLTAEFEPAVQTDGTFVLMDADALQALYACFDNIAEGAVTAENADEYLQYQIEAAAWSGETEEETVYGTVFLGLNEAYDLETFLSEIAKAYFAQNTDEDIVYIEFLIRITVVLKNREENPFAAYFPSDSEAALVLNVENADVENEKYIFWAFIESA